jgi:anion-transporting  ArsA/GET3 family ATPase
MDNQHKKIKGYRDLSQEEIDLMNLIKEHGEKTKELLDNLENLRVSSGNFHGESFRCLNEARSHLQTGQMWFVRAVALPESF